MKKYLLASILSVVALLHFNVNESHAVSFKEENNSNIYLAPTYNNFESDVITIDWSTSQSVENTYWAVHNFKGGYAGFQDQGNNKRTFHFALWDAVDDTEDKIKIDYLSPLTKGGSFGNEGTGMNASTPFYWEENEWYTMIIRNWHEDGRTKYGQWVKKPDGTWLLTAILNHPDGNYVMDTSSLFQEDFGGPKEDTRSFKVKNHYSLDTNTREWHSYDEKNISNNRGPESDVWNGGATSEYFWGEVGPKVTPSISDGAILKIDQPATPDMPEIKLDSFKVNIKNNQLKANWQLNETSSPQFSANLVIKNSKGKVKKTFDSVQAYDETFTTAISDFDAQAGDTVCLSITDVYNNTKEFTYEDDLDLDFDVNENVVDSVRLIGIFNQDASVVDLRSNGQVVYKKENVNWPNNDKSGDYMGLTVTRGNEEIYKKILDAKNDQIFSDSIQLEKGDILDIYHEDPERIYCLNKNYINYSNKHNYLEYTGTCYINKEVQTENNPGNGETSDTGSGNACSTGTESGSCNTNDSSETGNEVGNSGGSNGSSETGNEVGNDEETNCSSETGSEVGNAGGNNGNAGTDSEVGNVGGNNGNAGTDSEVGNAGGNNDNSETGNVVENDEAAVVEGTVNSSSIANDFLAVANNNEGTNHSSDIDSEVSDYSENYAEYNHQIEHINNGDEKLPSTGAKNSIYLYVVGIVLLVLSVAFFLYKKFYTKD